MNEQQLTDELYRLSAHILDLQLRFDTLKVKRATLRRKRTEGRGGTYTTEYRVREAKVRGYTRRAYRAIRVGKFSRAKTV